MSPTVMCHELRYVIPSEEVCTKSSALLDILVGAGLDPAGLSYTDLIPVAVKMKVTELAYEALDRGITINNSCWSRTPDGGAEVVFSFDEVADAVMFKTWIT